MSPKQGRPFEEKGKRGRIEIRTSEAEEQMLEYCTKRTGKNKTDIVRQGIKEVYSKLLEDNEEQYDESVELKISVTCPYCDANNRIVVDDYEFNANSYDTGENRMGPEIEHHVECSDFMCKSCGKRFSFEGQVWEYPIGTLECKEVKSLKNEN